LNSQKALALQAKDVAAQDNKLIHHISLLEAAKEIK
jgi:hypothetical protein